MTSPYYRFTILGSGSSGGVPRIGGHWGACDPTEPKNRRRRCSLLVERFGDAAEPTTVLIDTSPDIREQLLDANVSKIDAVLYTHEHADQMHGIDDLRMVAMNMWQRVDVYADKRTHEVMMDRFGYCFRTPEGSDYPPILSDHLISDDLAPIVIDGPGGAIQAIPFWQDHGRIDSLGFRIGNMAYSSDVVGLPDKSFDVLQNLECWIVDALRYTRHPTHANVDMALDWIERAKPKQGVLTNLHVDLDYRTLKSTLPSHVVPAYDGMTIEIPA